MNHARGKHKARVFASALGLTVDETYILRDALLQAVHSQEAQDAGADQYGQRYWVDFEMVTHTGAADVRSVWIIRRGEDVPRFVTAYVIQRRKR